MKKILIEANYLPSIAYFAALYHADIIILEGYDHHQKQSLRNRTAIPTANKIDLLSIPVLKPSTPKVFSKDIKIDYIQKWQNRHWRAIQSAYGKAPYFEYFSDTLHDMIYADYTTLFELNVVLIKVCFQLLGIRKEIILSQKFLFKEDTPEDTIDLRRTFSKKDTFTSFLNHPYQQIFNTTFVPNMSIIDLLFCEGSAASGYLKMYSDTPEIKKITQG